MSEELHMAESKKVFSHPSENPQDFLAEGSEIFDTIHEEGMDIHLVRSMDLEDGEQALLFVKDVMRPCVYAGENPLELEVEQGYGTLNVVELASGRVDAIFLEPGKSATVPTGVVYWYENQGTESDGDLVITDTCIGFNPEHEPALESVIMGLKNLSAAQHN